MTRGLEGSDLIVLLLVIVLRESQNSYFESKGGESALSFGTCFTFYRLWELSH